MTAGMTESETVITKILPYLRRRLYDPDNDFAYEESVNYPDCYDKGYADLVYNGGKKTPQFLIEVKRNLKKLTNQDRDQAIRYGKALKVPFVIVTNGNDIQVFNTKTKEAICWNGKAAQKIPTKLQLSQVLKQLRSDSRASDIILEDDDSLPYRPGLPRKQLERLFARCHNTIRKIEKHEENAFADISRLLFLKLLEEKNDQGTIKLLPYSYRFHLLADLPDHKADQVQDAIVNMLKTIEKSDLGGVLVGRLQVKNPKTTQYLVKQLAAVSFSDCNLDTKGAAFEYFVRATLKGRRLGQYFTPRPLIELMARLAGGTAILAGLRSGSGLRVIDPACGTGGFLLFLMQDALKQLDEDLAQRRVASSTAKELTTRLHSETFYGSDASAAVAATAKMNMVIAGDGHSNIHTEDSLKAAAKIWNWEHADADYIFSNPPFGTSESDTLDQTDLQHYAVKDNAKGQHYFLQRMIESSKPGGIICTVIDDGLLNTARAATLRRHVVERTDVLAVVQLPPETFQPNKINVRSSVLLLRKLAEQEPDLGRTTHTTFVDLESLGYLGSGVNIRGFDYDTLYADFDILVNRGMSLGIRSGAHWQAFDIALSQWKSDDRFRLDVRYWKAVALEKSTAPTLGKCIKDVNKIETRRGKSPSAELYVDADEGYAVVIKAGSCITKFGELRINGADFIEQQVYDEMPDAVKLRHGDVLLASTGDGTLGKACVFEMRNTPAIADGHVTIIRVDPKVIAPRFLADYLRVGYGRSQIDKLYTGSTGLIEIAPQDVGDIKLPFDLSLAVQRTLAKSLRTAERKSKRQESQIEADLTEAARKFRDGC